MNGKILVGAVLALVIVVGGIFVLIGVLNDAGSNTDDPGDGTLPSACGPVAAGPCAVPVPA